mmetsp:Transcript_26927/g.23769  ORF Transcript_26927/g.23769 Transcript_26927/m.23769 type:complete len:80 (-) Transcript_26927:594-833(-)
MQGIEEIRHSKEKCIYITKTPSSEVKTWKDYYIIGMKLGQDILHEICNITYGRSDPKYNEKIKMLVLGLKNQDNRLLRK